MCMGNQAVTAAKRLLLPQLSKPVVLFSGRCDITVPQQHSCGAPATYRPGDPSTCKYFPYNAEQASAIRSLIKSPLVERWIAENLVAPFPAKMRPMPLGFFPPSCEPSKYNDKANAKANFAAGWPCTNVWPMARHVRRHDDSLDRPRSLRMNCFGNVRTSPDYDDRRKLIDRCGRRGQWNNFSDPLPEKKNFSAYLHALAGAAFTACAHGGGVDPAPKSFEALAMGSIPIVTSSALDGAYRKLPVVVIDSWDDAEAISVPKLERWHGELAPLLVGSRRDELEERLTLDFWQGQLLLGTSASLESVAPAPDLWVDARAVKRAPLALVHVGPHKMGSTSIQAAIASFRTFLADDGFEVPGVRLGRQRLDGMAAFLRCGQTRPGGKQELARFPMPLQCHDTSVRKGWVEVQEAIEKARKARRGIIISAEGLDLPEVDIETLATELRGFNLTAVVVAMNRPFYDWIVSMHKQTSERDLSRVSDSSQVVQPLFKCMAAAGKGDSCPKLANKSLSELSMQYTPIVDWLTEETVRHFLPSFTPAVLKRYAGFGWSLAQPMSASHPPAQLLEGFFCRGWTPRTCNALRQEYADEHTGRVMSTAAPVRRSTTMSAAAQNVRAVEVAIGGMRTGWLPGDVPALGLVLRIKRVLGSMGVGELPVRCIDEHMEGLLLNTTLEAHALIFGELGFSEREVLREGFRRAAASTLCSIDVERLRHVEGLESSLRSSAADAPHHPRRVRIVVSNVGESNETWVPVQARMVRRWVDLPFALYTSVNDGSEQSVSRHWQAHAAHTPALVVSHSAIAASSNWRSLMDRCFFANISCDHAIQLDYLIRQACHKDAPAEDVLLVLDSDAWPLATFSEHVLPLLDASPSTSLVAVRRRVEGMALWPHPSFAVSSCGTWADGNLSWGSMPPLTDARAHAMALMGSIYAPALSDSLCHRQFATSKAERSPGVAIDTGGTLWPRFNNTSGNWVALERANQVNLDLLFYGVYASPTGVAVAYHHGAGQRSMLTSKVSPKSQDYIRAAASVRDAAQSIILGRHSGPEDLAALLLSDGPPAEGSAISASVVRDLIGQCRRVRTLALGSPQVSESCRARSAELCEGWSREHHRPLGVVPEPTPQPNRPPPHSFPAPHPLRARLELIHIPKTGGTSIETWGLRQREPLKLGRYNPEWPLCGNSTYGCQGRGGPTSWLPCSAWHTPPALIRQRGVQPFSRGVVTMCALRNPFDRAVSQLSWRVRGQRDSHCTAQSLNDRLHEALNERVVSSLKAVSASFPHLTTEDIFRNVSGPSCMDPCARKRGVGACKRACQQVSVLPAFTQDCHWLPQWMFVASRSDGKPECEHRLRTETLTADLASLLSELGEHTLAGQQLTVEDNVNRQNTTCPLRASMLNATSEALIRTVYAEDFARYGFATSIDRRDSAAERSPQIGSPATPKKGSPVTAPPTASPAATGTGAGCAPLASTHQTVNPKSSARDEQTKLLIVSTPKAGATLALRLMLARLNLTAEAARYASSQCLGRGPSAKCLDDYALDYTHGVLSKQPGRSFKRDPTLRSCARKPWLCVKFVRNPLDRAVSSYIYTMSDQATFVVDELTRACGRDLPASACAQNASFAEWAVALGVRARSGARSRGDGHFLLQAPSAPLPDGVLLVPIEMMGEADVAACEPLAPLQPQRLASAEAAAGVATDQHYQTHTASSASGSEHWPFARVAAAARAHATPTYDSFWANRTFCREVVGCLYRPDVALYASACTDTSSPLRRCAAYRRACDRELARLRGTCGLDDRWAQKAFGLTPHYDLGAWTTYGRNSLAPTPQSSPPSPPPPPPPPPPSRAPRTTHHAPRTTHRAPPTAHHAPRTAHRAPPTAHRAPRTAHQAPRTHHKSKHSVTSRIFV